MDKSQIDECFPFDSFRDGQKEAIEYAIDCFNDGKDIVFIEAPTGSGKSCIGMTLSNMVNTSFYLTITKILQDQLVNEFGADWLQLSELKGRNSYPCTFWGAHGKQQVDDGIVDNLDYRLALSQKPSCDEGYCRTHALKSEKIGQNKCRKCFSTKPIGESKPGSLTVLPQGMSFSACPYYEQVHRAVSSKTVVMNFSSFLFQMQTDRFGQRDLMIIDEGHATESTFLDFISLIMDDRLLSSEGITIPKLESASDYAVWFAQNDIESVLGNIMKSASFKILDPNLDTRSKLKSLREQDDANRLLDKFKMFMDNICDNEWVVEFETIRRDNLPGFNKITLKPVMVKNFIHNMLFSKAKKILIMSATILDIGVMCQSLGIDRSKVGAYRMKNRFPVDSRPIYYKPAAKVVGGSAAQHTWGPKLVKAVTEIAKKYPDDRGIIHTHNFAIAEMLRSDCPRDISNRFTYQKGFADKQDMLDFHARTHGSIIIAPAMHEGVDLKGDLSRFQIICKVPFPNFHENKQLQRRMEIDTKYYPWLVALKLVQSYGRSVRSETDWADTYVIDESFKRFVNENRKLLPTWFIEAIKW